MTSDPATTRVGGAVAGAALAASAWISAGTLAVVNASSLARVGALPDATWLAVGLVAGAGMGALVRPRRSTLAPLSLLALLWLPWLPARVPSPFLMWEGPLEGLVWATAVAAVTWRVAGTRAAAALAPWSAPPRAPFVVAALAVAVFASAWMTARPRVPAGDEPHYLVITQSLLRDGDFAIENNHQQDQYLEYYDGALKPDFMQRGVDGQIYSIHAPGVSALVLPAFAVAGYRGAVATVIVVAAAGLSAAWIAAYWLTASTGAAWTAWLALVVAAPVVLHGYTVYPDGVGAAAAMAGVLGLVALDRSAGVALPLAGWAAIGGALALLPWLHTRFALVAGVLGLAIVLRLRPRSGGARAITAFLVPALLAAAAWLAYFWRIYGTPNPAAPYGARPEGGLDFVPAGVVGLLSDQQFGLVANAPVLLAGVIGLVPLARRQPRLAVELVAVLGPYLCAVSTYPMWWGGYSAPGRFAVVVLPMLALPIAAWWSDGPAGRRVIGVLTALSAAITVTLVAHDRGAFIYNGRDGHALLLDWLSPTVDLTLGAPSVHRDGAAAAAGDAAVWLLAGVVVAGAWTLLTRRWPGRSLASTAGMLAAPVAAMAALPVVWAGRDRPAVTPPTSQMALLDRWQPGWRPLGLEVSPPRPLSLDDLVQRLSLGTSLRGQQVPGVSPLLQIPLVPAGEFDVFVEGRSRLDGRRHGAARARGPADGDLGARRPAGGYHRTGAAPAGGRAFDHDQRRRRGPGVGATAPAAAAGAARLRGEPAAGAARGALRRHGAVRARRQRLPRARGSVGPGRAHARVSSCSQTRPPARWPDCAAAPWPTW